MADIEKLTIDGETYDISDPDARDAASTAQSAASTAQSTADTALSGLTDGSVTKVGTETVGDELQPIYLNSGVPTASTSTVGDIAHPLYMNAGIITPCTCMASYTSLDSLGLAVADVTSLNVITETIGSSAMLITTINNADSATLQGYGVLPIAVAGTLEVLRTNGNGRCTAWYISERGVTYICNASNPSSDFSNWDSDSYASGDTITVQFDGAGYCTTSSTQVNFTIPVSKPLRNVSSITASSQGGFILRQGGYTHGSDSGSPVSPSTVTYTYRANVGLYVDARFSSTSGATNNAAIGINMASTTLTLS